MRIKFRDSCIFLFAPNNAYIRRASSHHLHKKNSNKRSSILAILPTGVVQFYAKNPENIAWLYFPNIAKIELAYEAEIVGFDGDVGTRIYYWLDVYCTDGTYLKWHINKCFGDTAAIGKSIIAMYNYHCHHYNFFP